MATITKKVDDIDGSDATETVTFGYKGQSFTIDLSDNNSELFEALMSVYVAAATPVVAPERSVKATRGTGKGNTPAKYPAGYLEAVRAWAKDNGHKVAPKGRIAASVLEAYQDHLRDESAEAQVIARIKTPEVEE